MDKLKEFIKKERLAIIGAGIGILGGFFYWRFVGCNSGTCPITSSPFYSSLWGGLMGGLLFDMFKKSEKKEAE